MFSGRASLAPTGRTHSTHKTPALRARERVLKKVGQKVGDEKEYKRKEKSIVASQNLIHLVVPLLFCLGRRSWFAVSSCRAAGDRCRVVVDGT